MKILVTVKRVLDPDQKIRANADGTAVADDDLTFVMNPFDAIALEEGLRIREELFPDSEIVAVGIGSAGYEQELRQALAMGADRGVLVSCDEKLDPWNVAQVLRAIVERERPDLVLMGKQAVDDDANQAGQFLAALLDWPQATFASKIEFVENGVQVARETDLGIETVAVALPAVITADLRLNEPRYASMPSIIKAKRKPVDRIGVADVGVAIDPRVQLRHVEVSSSSRNCVMVSSVDELIGQLRNAAKVI